MERIKPLKASTKIEFGDFQTPAELAQRIVCLLRQKRVRPRSIFEPTCGVGNLLLAAADEFSNAESVEGTDVNSDYLRQLKQTIRNRKDRARFRLIRQNVLNESQPTRFHGPEPWLVIGNPPWVTNSTIGTMRGENLPSKKNSEGTLGIEALTGRSNFDISEWILRRLVDALNGRQATLAMLCKTSVARKILAYAWQNEFQIESAALYLIDAQREFSAAVDACLLVCHFRAQATSTVADVFGSFDSHQAISRIAWRSGRIVADAIGFDRWKHLHVGDSNPRTVWRSGVKHDCAEILELERRQKKFWNGLGEPVDIESQHVFPLLKSSDLAQDTQTAPRRWLLLPQRRLNDDPADVLRRAPRTWQYLVDHAHRLDRRRSRIYRARPQFSVFGLGDYTFARYKVAVSGFYKRLQFRVVGIHQGRPCLLDDTCYFVPCSSHEEAERLCNALNSDIARDFFSSLIFWDNKRPITARLLAQLDIERLLCLALSARRIANR